MEDEDDEDDEDEDFDCEQFVILPPPHDQGDLVSFRSDDGEEEEEDGEDGEEAEIKRMFVQLARRR